MVLLGNTRSIWSCVLLVSVFASNYLESQAKPHEENDTPTQNADMSFKQRSTIKTPGTVPTKSKQDGDVTTQVKENKNALVPTEMASRTLLDNKNKIVSSEPGTTRMLMATKNKPKLQNVQYKTQPIIKIPIVGYPAMVNDITHYEAQYPSGVGPLYAYNPNNVPRGYTFPATFVPSPYVFTNYGPTGGYSPNYNPLLRPDTSPALTRISDILKIDSGPSHINHNSDCHSKNKEPSFIVEPNLNWMRSFKNKQTMDQQDIDRLLALVRNTILINRPQNPISDHNYILLLLKKLDTIPEADNSQIINSKLKETLQLILNVTELYGTEHDKSAHPGDFYNAFKLLLNNPSNNHSQQQTPELLNDISWLLYKKPHIPLSYQTEVVKPHQGTDKENWLLNLLGIPTDLPLKPKRPHQPKEFKPIIYKTSPQLMLSDSDLTNLLRLILHDDLQSSPTLSIDTLKRPFIKEPLNSFYPPLQPAPYNPNIFNVPPTIPIPPTMPDRDLLYLLQLILNDDLQSLSNLNTDPARKNDLLKLLKWITEDNPQSSLKPNFIPVTQPVFKVSQTGPLLSWPTKPNSIKSIPQLMKVKPKYSVKTNNFPQPYGMGFLKPINMNQPKIYPQPLVDNLNSYEIPKLFDSKPKAPLPIRQYPLHLNVQLNRLSFPGVAPSMPQVSYPYGADHQLPLSCELKYTPIPINERSYNIRNVQHLLKLIIDEIHGESYANNIISSMTNYEIQCKFTIPNDNCCKQPNSYGFSFKIPLVKINDPDQSNQNNKCKRISRSKHIKEKKQISNSDPPHTYGSLLKSMKAESTETEEISDRMTSQSQSNSQYNKDYEPEQQFPSHIFYKRSKAKK